MLATLGLASAQPATADTGEPESVNSRFNRIFETYEIGDVLSAEDAAFVEQHALSMEGASARETHIISGSRTFGGNTYYISGNWYHNDDPDSAMWHRYGATVQAGSSTITSQRITVGMRFLAYGFTGSSYELIHKDEQSDYWDGIRWFTSEFSGMYMGILAYSSASCYARINTYTGSSFLVE